MLSKMCDKTVFSSKCFACNEYISRANFFQSWDYLFKIGRFEFIIISEFENLSIFSFY